MIAYRIADSRHRIFDSSGAEQSGGRWNSPGVPVIYASESYASALLEVLVHLQMNQPAKHHRLVKIFLPDIDPVETVNADNLADWDADDMKASRAVGDAWVAGKRTAVLRVPSIITRGHEFNLVINPAHPAFERIQVSAPEPVHWDTRLLRSRK